VSPVFGDTDLAVALNCEETCEFEPGRRKISNLLDAVFDRSGSLFFTRGGLVGGLWHPATRAAASVPPNGFVFEGALGKAPSISPGRFAVYAWRVVLVVVASCHAGGGFRAAERFCS
jgi:hypothetical protein